jgi:hypothetical protein
MVIGFSGKSAFASPTTPPRAAVTKNILPATPQ